MRMHKRKHLAERVGVLENTLMFRPENLVINEPVFLEVGCGKGGFICAHAEKNPTQSYVASEMIENVLILAAEKAQEMNIQNLRFVAGNFLKTAEHMPDGCCKIIYLNFSDPWPKKKHAKRRLTYKSFLPVYKRLLAEGGELHMKTDNRDLFLFSIESLSQNGFGLKNITWDLHNSPFCENNIMTEYETHFSSQGLPIYRLEAFPL
ncbi:MAG: tRNA (guanosine(46)-N7)-methyltransferase TrmB [Clostridia bacterium]|nr:tRNA (guanosine(46)-N7)-methyltransferase TrmB [Clostridia bacterium]